jgi:membrane protein implicated in regulation of membrane protease activity
MFDGLSYVAEFIRRNIITILIVLILTVAAPSVLVGITQFIFYFLCGLFLIALVVLIAFRWRMERLRREMEQHVEQVYTRRRREDTAVGDIHIYKNTQSTEKRINEKVGEYVDFEEVDDSKQ